MGEVVGLPLCFVSVFGDFEGLGHDTGVVNQTMQGALLGEEEFGC